MSDDFGKLAHHDTSYCSTFTKLSSIHTNVTFRDFLYALTDRRTPEDVSFDRSWFKKKSFTLPVVLGFSALSVHQSHMECFFSTWIIFPWTDDLYSCRRPQTVAFNGAASTCSQYAKRAVLGSNFATCLYSLPRSRPHLP